MFLLPKSKDIGLFKKQRKEIQSVPIPLLKALTEQIATERFKSERWTKSGQINKKEYRWLWIQMKYNLKPKVLHGTKGTKEGKIEWESLAWNVVSINTEQNVLKIQGKIETVVREQLNPKRQWQIK